MDYITVFIRLATIFSLGLFAWLVIAGSPLETALFRSFLVFLVLLGGLRIIISAIRLITDNSHREESGEQDMDSNKSVSHG